jgi:hypothetical protein
VRGANTEKARAGFGSIGASARYIQHDRYAGIRLRISAMSGLFALAST